MAVSINSLNDLLLYELSDLYSAEEQILEALPKLIAAASNEKLKQTLEGHLNATQQHVTRLNQVFKALKAKPSGEVCVGMKGLLAEGGKLLGKGVQVPPEVLDAAIIASAQRVEHYEMAGYGCARTYCQLLGEENCKALLQATLNEEGESNRVLTELAISGINLGAKTLSAGAAG